MRPKRPLANERSQVGAYRIAGSLFQITRSCVSLVLNLPDQPNRAVRTRMLRGVGGLPCEGRRYPGPAQDDGARRLSLLSSLGFF